MAAGGSLEANFNNFCKGGQATSKDITKWMTDAGVLGKGSCSSNNLDICFSKIKDKGQTKIGFAKLDALIAEVAKAYAKDHKQSEADAVTAIKEKLEKCTGPKLAGTKQSKTGGVDKMTDASKYTGSHKERFDKDGKGKGIEGRADKADNSGYVGNYKGEGTYDKKK